jgi:hypothetical protein
MAARDVRGQNNLTSWSTEVISSFDGAQELLSAVVSQRRTLRIQRSMLQWRSFDDAMRNGSGVGVAVDPAVDAAVHWCHSVDSTIDVGIARQWTQRPVLHSQWPRRSIP